MTIDERLERLAERHESLAQSVEMLVIERRATDKRIRNLSKQMSDLGKFTNEIAVGTARLLSIAEAHEHRIPRLEGNL